MLQELGKHPSPSQMVLLRGEVFTRRRGKLELPSGAKASSRELGETLMMVAFLACASEGVLELQIRPQKALFGLRSVRALFVEPQLTSVPWPQSTLEAWLAHLALQLRPEGQHRVRTLVYVLLRENSTDPWRQIVEEVQGGLVALGILERQEDPRLSTTRRRRARVATLVEDSVLSLPIDHVRGLVESYRRSAPQIWRLLRREVSQGISHRRGAVAVRPEDDYRSFR
jgi:hypothetical protein